MKYFIALIWLLLEFEQYLCRNSHDFTRNPLLDMDLALGLSTVINCIRPSSSSLPRLSAYLDNHINPVDLEEFRNYFRKNWVIKIEVVVESVSSDDSDTDSVDVDCFGLEGAAVQMLWFLDMKPGPAHEIVTDFFFFSRNKPMGRQVFPGKEFSLNGIDFRSRRKTVVIIHGFMTYGNATWVQEMISAFLKRDDVNVISVDWSHGGNTWKYWRAVTNTRKVGADVARFLRQLMQATGAKPKAFHLVGHSLGAHICSYASNRLGGVYRITGLDPAQPCFKTYDMKERLDQSDADFVDIIHTNGRLLTKLGFGMPDPCGHADFYPNGGMIQPGCKSETNKWENFWDSHVPSFMSHIKLYEAICSHGRAYLLFTESLISRNCTFIGHKWDLTYEGVNASLKTACGSRRGSCSQMGIAAIGNRDTNRRPRGKGNYFVLTRANDPFCPSKQERLKPYQYLLQDLLEGFNISPRPPPATTTYLSWIDKIFGFYQPLLPY